MTAPAAPSAGEHWDEVYAGHREDGVSWYQPAPEPSLRLLRAAAPVEARVWSLHNAFMASRAERASASSGAQ